MLLDVGWVGWRGGPAGFTWRGPCLKRQLLVGSILDSLPNSHAQKRDFTGPPTTFYSGAYVLIFGNLLMLTVIIGKLLCRAW